MTNPQLDSFETIDVVCTEAPIPDEIVSAVTKTSRKSTQKPTPRPRNHTPTRLSWCLRMAYYWMMNFPMEQLDSEDFSSAFNLFRGNALHDAFAKIYPWHELPLKAPIPIGSGKSVTVSGRLDLYRPSDATILDLKTSKYVAWQKKSGFLPRLKDIQQLQIYSVMYGPVLPVKKLQLIYADMADVICYDVPVAPNAESWLIQRLQIVESSIVTSVAPSGEVSKMCDFCPFQTRCKGELGGITTLPKSHPIEEIKNE